MTNHEVAVVVCGIINMYAAREEALRGSMFLDTELGEIWDRLLDPSLPIGEVVPERRLSAIRLLVDERGYIRHYWWRLPYHAAAIRSACLLRKMDQSARIHRINHEREFHDTPQPS